MSDRGREAVRWCCRGCEVADGLRRYADGNRRVSSWLCEGLVPSSGRTCENQGVRALLGRGEVKYVAWGNAAHWRTVLGEDVSPHSVEGGLDATVASGGNQTQMEAYRTEGYRGRSEVRLRTPPLISGDAQLVQFCRDNAEGLDPDVGGDPSGLVAYRGGSPLSAAKDSERLPGACRRGRAGVAPWVRRVAAGRWHGRGPGPVVRVDR